MEENKINKQKQYSKKYYQKNKEEISKKNKIRYELKKSGEYKPNPRGRPRKYFTEEEAKEAQKQQIRNFQKTEKYKLWRENNKEKLKNYSKKYYHSESKSITE